MITYKLDDYIDWIKGLILGMETNNKNVLFTTFEEFNEDNDAFFKKILNHYNIPIRFWRGLRPKKSMKKTRFRKGLVDEWRSVFSKQQIERINAKIPDEWFERFGWTRY
jgi:hypothetical protein